MTAGEKFNWRKAWGSAANGAVVGAARGALVGSGAGIPLAFATDFTAGSIGDALEQKITTGRVNLGKSLLGGAENALSQMLYGTGELKGVGDAFWRGAKTGALSSGFRNIEEALWPERSRDPKGMCGSPDPFELTQGFGNGRGYQSPSAHGEGGFSLGGLVKDMVAGGIVGGLGSAGFYGAGKALDALKSSVVGRRDGVPQILLKGEPNTRVYLGIKHGKADYVGITYDIEKRQMQHGRRFDYLREITTEPLTRRQARAIEQVLIERNPQFSNSNFAHRF